MCDYASCFNRRLRNPFLRLMKNRAIVFSLFVCAAIPLLQAASQATVVHLDDVHQTVLDFGASDCWLGDYVGRYFTDNMKERAAKLLFARSFNRAGQPEGIGLSNWRVNLGAGSATQGDDSNISDPTRRTECFLAADGITYNWNAAPGQRYFMQKAVEYGVESILLFSNSAPIYYTANGKACKTSTLPWGANLRSDAYDDFAEYMATVAKHFVDMGYPVTYISPVNEPQYEWVGGQEGTPWYNTEIARLARELNTSLERRNLQTRILIPEAGKWTYFTESYPLINDYGYNQIDQFFNPDNTTTYVGDLAHMERAVAGHSYWTFRTNDDLVNRRAAVAQAAAARNLMVFQSEWSMLDEPPYSSTGFPAGGYDEATYMDIALFMGKLIYCDMVYAGVSSWNYWTAFAQEQWGQKNRFYLLRVNANGDTGTESYGDLHNGGTIVDNRNLWVLGNYARFIRPGYKRVGVTGADNINSLMASAYLSPDTDELVVVYVNMAHSPAMVTVDIAGNDALRLSTIKSYTTSQTYALHYDASLASVYNGEQLEIPARSVVTLVMGLESNSTETTGDLNGDGVVDVEDVNVIINNILNNTVEAALHAASDLTHDGTVDVEDLNALVNIILSVD